MYNIQKDMKLKRVCQISSLEPIHLCDAGVMLYLRFVS